MFKKSLLAVSLAGLLAAPAYADVTINGFASINAGIALDKNDSLYGYDDSLDFKNESLFAIQIMSDLGEKLSVTAQLMGRGSNDFDVGFEWAFISYQINDDWRINAGRLRTPFYKYSDFRDVGYSYDWLRVPQSVYGLGYDNIEGVSLYHTTQLGSFDSSLQFVAGTYDGIGYISGNDLNVKFNDIVGVTWELSQDWFSVRAAYLAAKVTIGIDSIQLNATTTVGGVLAGLSNAGLDALVSEIDVADENGAFLGLGFTLDKNDWLVVAEYTTVKVSKSFVGDKESYYGSVGHRFDKLTPYVSYEKEKRDVKTAIYTPYTTTLPQPTLGAVVGIVQSQNRDANTYNVGLRYDFHPSAAFKVQYSSEDNNIADVRQSVLALGVDLVF
ncbi:MULTISPECIES: porin [Rheinheimera]|uniref:porin n=1 Tax=Rheinheimera TaxID=67575 RepID=UPI00104BD537|nr:porin [Rheinheimera sp. D18]QBL10320.1 porin [Rheinheimera sp. D18]